MNWVYTRKRKRFISRNCLTYLWRLASLKCSGQACWLENQGELIFQLRAPRCRIPSAWGEISIFLLKPSIDWLRPTQIVESNLLFSKSTDINRHRHWPVDISLTSFLNMFLLLLHSSLISCLITSNILRLLPTQGTGFFFSLSGVICPPKGTSLLPHFVQLSD